MATSVDAITTVSNRHVCGKCGKDINLNHRVYIERSKLGRFKTFSLFNIKTKEICFEWRIED